MMEGNNKVLDIEDLWRLEENHLMDNVSTTFDHHFEVAMTEANVTAGVLPPLKGNNVVSKFWSSPLTRAVVKMYRREFIVSGVTKFFNTFVQFLPSLVVAVRARASRPTRCARGHSWQAPGRGLDAHDAEKATAMTPAALRVTDCRPATF